jgi:hypothetical protein
MKFWCFLQRLKISSVYYAGGLPHAAQKQKVKKERIITYCLKVVLFFYYDNLDNSNIILYLVKKLVKI